MHSARLILALGISVVALVACGNYDNDDIAFLEALPDKSALQVQVPASTGEALQQDASLHELTVGVAQDIDNGLTAILDVLDILPTISPSQRTATSRTWGPYDDQSHAGFQVEVTITRETTDYVFAMNEQKKGSAAAFVPLITGTFFSQSAHLGHGTLVYNNTAAIGLGLPGEDPNLLTINVVYANDQSPRTVNTTIDQLNQSNGTPQTVSYEYQEQPDGGGQLVFDLDEDPWGDGGLADLHLVSVWNPTGAGRSDGDFTGPLITATLGDGGYVSASECWSATFAETYYDSEIYLAGSSVPDGEGYGCSLFAGHAGGCPDGDPGACVLPAAWP